MANSRFLPTRDGYTWGREMAGKCYVVAWVLALIGFALSLTVILLVPGVVFFVLAFLALILGTVFQVTTWGIFRGAPAMVTRYAREREFTHNISYLFSVPRAEGTRAFQMMEEMLSGGQAPGKLFVECRNNLVSLASVDMATER